MNPTNPIASYLRHLIVVVIMLAIAKFKFPLDGASDFADSLALTLIGSATWALVKYAPAFARSIGILAVLIAVSPPSCTATIGPDGKPVLGLDPVELARAISAVQRETGAKGASVVILDPSGKAIPTLPESAPPKQ